VGVLVSVLVSVLVRVLVMVSCCLLRLGAAWEVEGEDRISQAVKMNAKIAMPKNFPMGRGLQIISWLPRVSMISSRKADPIKITGFL
jgi:hypothetical protein